MWKKIITLFVILSVLTSGGVLLGKDDTLIEDNDMKLPEIVLKKEENAFYDFIEAVERRYRPDDKGETERINNILQGKEWDPVFVEDVLTKNKEMFFYLNKVANYKIFQAPQWEDPQNLSINTPLVSMGGWRSVARLHALKALYFFNQGKEKEAFDEIIKILKIGQLIKNSPRADLVQMLTAIAMEDIGLERLRVMIAKTNLPAEELRFYKNELGNYKSNKSGIKTILTEEYIVLAKVLREEPRELSPFAPLYIKMMIKIPFYYKVNQTRNLFLKEFKNQMANFDKNYCNEVKVADFLANSSIPGIWIMKLFTENLIGKIIYETTMMDYLSIALRQCKEDFSIKSAQILVALKMYKAKNGDLPDSLTGLIPDYLSEVPKDPFDGQPIRFSTQNKIIYSVGADLKDDGGSEGEDWKEMEDPTFKIEL